MAPVFELVQKGLASEVLSADLSLGLLALDAEPSRVAGIAQRLKADFGFDMLLDVTAVDWPDREPRFDVVWHFYSTTHFVRVRLKTRVGVDDPTVDTFIGMYGSARVMERECHEMYGIVFRGNDDLRPMLLYEGFVGHPLRKDYPKHKEQPLVAYTGPAGDRP